MHIVLWRYRARPGCEAEFESAYGDQGVWSRFFQSDPGYLGTDFLRASDGTYLTMDKWVSSAAYDAFLVANPERYAELDKETSALTSEETPLGAVEV